MSVEKKSHKCLWLFFAPPAGLVSIAIGTATLLEKSIY